MWHLCALETDVTLLRLHFVSDATLLMTFVMRHSFQPCLSATFCISDAHLHQGVLLRAALFSVQKQGVLLAHWCFNAARLMCLQRCNNGQNVTCASELCRSAWTCLAGPPCSSIAPQIMPSVWYVALLWCMIGLNCAVSKHCGMRPSGYLHCQGTKETKMADVVYAHHFGGRSSWTSRMRVSVQQRT